MRKVKSTKQTEEKRISKKAASKAKGKEPKPKEIVTQPKPKEVSAHRAFMADLIGKGKFTKKEILEKTAERFPKITTSTISTILSDSKNPKYNRFDKLVEENAETKVFSFLTSPEGRSGDAASL